MFKTINDSNNAIKNNYNDNNNNENKHKHICYNALPSEVKIDITDDDDCDAHNCSNAKNINDNLNRTHINGDVEAQNDVTSNKEKRKTREDIAKASLSPSSSSSSSRHAVISKVFIDDLTVQRQRIWRVPWFIVNMCFVQISIYTIANDCIYQHLMFIPAQRHQYWRYLTYTLIHSDHIHLLLNLTLQLVIGFGLESEQGHWKVAAIYVAGGISGSLATEQFEPQLSLVGASASVYALLMSHVPHLIKNFIDLPYRFLRIIALTILCLSDASFTVHHFLVNHNTNPRICLVAHLAGGLCGLCTGYILYSHIHRRR